MTLIQDVRRDGNQGGRCAGSLRDGQYTRYVEIIDHTIEVYDSEGTRLHRGDRLPDDFQPLAITTTRSGFDGKLIVTVGGFTINAHDSRRITVKTGLTILEPWEKYE